MNSKLETLEKCPCCGGKLYYKSLDRIVEGGYEKACFVCMSSIDNIDFSEDIAKLKEPNLNKGYGCLHLSLNGEYSSGVFVDKDYKNIQELIEFANEEVSKGKASLEHSYLYKFNPETNTGEFIWGNYNPLKEE